MPTETVEAKELPKIKLNVFQAIKQGFVVFTKDYLSKISSQTLGWIAIMLCHFAPIPTLISVLMQQSDKLPPVDMVMFIWAALITFFIKALIDRNFLYMSTICVGFVGQCILMGLILFK